MDAGFADDGDGAFDCPNEDCPNADWPKEDCPNAVLPKTLPPVADWLDCPRPANAPPAGTDVVDGVSAGLADENAFVPLPPLNALVLVLPANALGMLPLSCGFWEASAAHTGFESADFCAAVPNALLPWVAKAAKPPEPPLLPKALVVAGFAGVVEVPNEDAPKAGFPNADGWPNDGCPKLDCPNED